MLRATAAIASYLAVLAAPPPADPARATAEFVVTVPSGTPPGDSIYIAGGDPALGSWSPTGVRLERGADGKHRARVELPRGAEVEFKVTRGSWGTVEKDAAGAEIANRRIKLSGDQRVEVVVATWESGGGPRPAASGSGSPPRRPSSASARVRVHSGFHSQVLGNERVITVWVPPGYEESAERYPVFYLHDGQNLFDAATAAFGFEWRADETAERLVAAGRIRSVLLVGIANTPARIDEYTPWPDPKLARGGKGDLYGRFLVEEVKPFIDRTYRTLPAREDTAVGGSSLGGLISIHLAMRHPKTFGLCAALSPSLFWANRSVLRECREEPARLRSIRFWLDMGTAEGPAPEARDVPEYILDLRSLGETLDAAGLLPGRDYYLAEMTGARHDEAAWAARFDKVLLFLFGK